MHHLILASNSPRRQELLQQAGYQFQVVTYDFDEVIPKGMDVNIHSRVFGKREKPVLQVKIRKSSNHHGRHYCGLGWKSVQQAER